MVWVVTGNLLAGPDDPEGVPPPETSHYLRPSRLYQLGRAAYTPAPTAKQANPVPTKARLYDFKLKSMLIGKAGAWILQTGGWTEEQVNDNPNSPTNLDPYSLTLSTLKTAFRITHADTSIDTVTVDAPVLIQSGDRVAFLGCAMSFEWIPIFPCFTASNVAFKKKYTTAAITLGIKLGYKIFNPSIHTHFITKGLTASTSLQFAAMASAYVASPKWFEAFMASGAPLPFPTDMPEAPGAQKEGETDKQFDKRVSMWEMSLLALDPMVGADPSRWFGHCMLEQMWGARPDEMDGKYACEIPAGFKHWTSEGWNKNEARSTLFKGILFISFSQVAYIQQIVEMGSGCYLSIDAAQNKDLKSISRVIESYRETNSIPGDIRCVVVAPESTEYKISAGEDGMARLVRAVAQHLGVTRYLSSIGMDLMEVIFAMDTSVLFGAPLDPSIILVEESPPVRARQAPAPTPSFEESPPEPTPSSTMASTMSRIPGTHPEESTLRPVPSFDQVPVAGPSGTSGADMPPPPTVARKLQRRVGKTLPSVYDRLLSVDSESAGRTGLYIPPTAQEVIGRVETVNSVGSSMDLDSSAAPTAAPRLKRRIGTVQEPRNSPFDYAPAPPAKKSRTAAHEEDEDEEADRVASLGRARKVVEEKRPLKRKTRGTSVVEEGSDEPGSSPVRKRTRSASLQPVVEIIKKTPAASSSTAKGKGKAVAGKGSKPMQGATDDSDAFLTMPTNKKKGGRDQEFNEDFNALHIVKPTIVPMRPRESVRVGWDQVDEERERDRMIAAEQHDRDHPDDWAGAGKGKFVIESFEVKARPARVPTVALEGKWAGMPNFKAFRPKGSTVPRITRPERIELVISAPQPVDFGLGDVYKSKSKGKKRDADVDFDDTKGTQGTQSKLNFKPAPKAVVKAAPRAASAAKGKGKAKLFESDDSDDSGTLEDQMDVDELESSEEEPVVKKKAPPKASATKASTSKAKATPAAKKPTATAAKKAPPPTMILIDSDSDSDSGLTFKGFKAKGSTARR